MEYAPTPSKPHPAVNQFLCFGLTSFNLFAAFLVHLDPSPLAARGGSTFSELRWYPPVEAAKGSLSWVFRAKQPESVRTGP